MTVSTPDLKPLPKKCGTCNFFKRPDLSNMHQLTVCGTCVALWPTSGVVGDHVPGVPFWAIWHAARVHEDDGRYCHAYTPVVTEQDIRKASPL